MTLPLALVYGAASQLLTAVAIGFTPSSSSLRPGILAVILALTWSFDLEVQDGLESRLHVALLSTAMWIQGLKTVDDLCLTRMAFDKQAADEAVLSKSSACNSGRQASKSTDATESRGQGVEVHGLMFKRRLLFGLGNLWNMRGLKTCTEIDQIPPWSEDEPSFVPSRPAELKRHAKNLMISYLVLDVFTLQTPPDLEGMMSPEQEPLFSRLGVMGAEEAIFRLFATFGFWVNTFCVIHLINSALSLLYLGLCIYSVELLPPIWGRLSEAYSIRQFWGKTWHQTIRRPLVHASGFIVHGVFRIQKGSLMARYSKLVVSFLFSGLLHYPADLSLNMATRDSNAITFFLTTACLIMCEDGVQHFFTETRKNHGRLAKLVGYIWVCGYMYWMTPSWAYPAARVVQPKDQLFPYSFLGWLETLR